MKIRKYLCISLVIAVLFSCEKYLEPKLTNDFGDDVTWKIPDYTLRMLLSVYDGIPDLLHWCDGNNYLDAITDNSLTTQTSSSLYGYVFGTATMHSNPIGNWSNCYNSIALANLFLEKGLAPELKYNLNNPTYDRMIRNRSRGEAYFLRAWWQHELLKNYGGRAQNGQALGFVIATRTFSDNDIEYANNLPRNTYEDCVKQILADCDSAIKYLPLRYSRDQNDKVISAEHPYGQSNYQRASQRSAHGLKSRVALLGASPAYQPAGAYALDEDSIKKKWLRAAIVAQEALTLGGMGTTADMLPLKNVLIVGNTVTQFPMDVGADAEMLFVRTRNDRNAENHHYPMWWFGQAKCNPSQNLVNAYPMKNGYPIIHPSSGYDPQNPYVNRDGRFVEHINFNGGKFCQIADERVMEIYGSADDGTIGRDAPGFDYRNTWTGYYIRKGMSNKPNRNYNPDNPGATNNDGHRNPLLRRGEIWFNLAEAMNEYAGPNGTITIPKLGTVITINDEDTIVTKVDVTTEKPIDIMKKLRTLWTTGTAYVDEVADQGPEAFRKFILDERRIEFAFENIRLWDIRRWQMPELNEPIYGVKIYAEYDRTVDEGKLVNSVWVPNLVRKYKYTYFGTDPNEEPVVVQKRNLSDPRHYTSPIPYSEMMKNPNLVQNAGWEMK